MDRRRDSKLDIPLTAPVRTERPTTRARATSGRWMEACQAWLTVVLACVVGVVSSWATPALANDFDIRRVVADEERLTIYHDPIVSKDPVEMRVELDEGGCDVSKPTQNIRQAGDSFATLIVIDRGDPMALGKWSKELLGGTGDFLRVDLMAQRAVQDDYALLDSYGEPPPREHPLSHNLVSLERFLEDAPPPAQAGAAVYRRTLDGMRLIEATEKPLRAVMIISDGRDPNLYPGGVADDALLIEKSKQLGAPIFAVLVSRQPRGKEHRALLQAAAQRLQALCVRTGGAVVQEVRADDKLRSSLAAALTNFSRQIATWQRTECDLCGAVSKGQCIVQMRALEAGDDHDVVGRTRKPYITSLSKLDELDSCSQCSEDGDCTCKGDVQPRCKEEKCVCAGDCEEDEDCEDNQVCRKGKCKQKPPWLLLGLAGAFLFFVVIVLAVIANVVWRVRANEIRRRDDEERRRRDQEEYQRRESEEQKRRAEEDRRKQEEAQRQQLARQQAIAAQAQAAARVPAPAAPAVPPARFRLHSKSAGYPDVALPEGATVIGGDPQEVQAAVQGLPPGTSGYPVVLSASTISGKHAVVRVVRGGVSITDFGSTNGTFVNGVKIAPNGIVELSIGDTVDLSKQVSFVLEAIPGF